MEKRKYTLHKKKIKKRRNWNLFGLFSGCMFQKKGAKKKKKSTTTHCRKGNSKKKIYSCRKGIESKVDRAHRSREPDHPFTMDDPVERKRVNPLIWFSTGTGFTRGTAQHTMKTAQLTDYRVNNEFRHGSF